MTTQPNPARSNPGLVLAHARRPGSNGHQKPTRRHQMLYAAAYAAEVLEDAAAGTADPEALRLAAAGLTAAARRLTEPRTPRRSPRPPRQSPRLPRPGRLTEAGRDVTLDEVDAVTAAAAAIVAAFDNR